VLQTGDLVRFFDYDAAAADRDRKNDWRIPREDYWRIGIVTDIRDEPWDDDWDPDCLPCVVVTSNCHSQPIVMPNENNIGTWVELITCKSAI
jgi:hypothetical protein